MKKLSLALVALTISGAAPAASVDLSSWTAEGGSSNWVLQSGNNSVLQTVNGDPTVFYSDFNAFGKDLAGTIRVRTTSDDDFIGFVLGFNPGNMTAASTNFLLIDWKQSNQSSFGCNADVGLSISHVSAGLANNAGGWCHEGNGVTELARATNLGATGWADNTLYDFTLEYSESNVKVYVNGLLEIDLNGSFSDGRFGFYNYSQQSVEYAGITSDPLPPVTPGAVPEPASWAMMIAGFALAGSAMRRRQHARIAFAS